MLVLSRKAEQEIKIGENISITILQVSGNKVRIGIDAPREIKVVRSELPPKRDDENQKAPSLRKSVQRQEFNVVSSDLIEPTVASIPMNRVDRTSEKTTNATNNRLQQILANRQDRESIIRMIPHSE